MDYGKDVRGSVCCPVGMKSVQSSRPDIASTASSSDRTDGDSHESKYDSELSNARADRGFFHEWFGAFQVVTLLNEKLIHLAVVNYELQQSIYKTKLEEIKRFNT
ncbi:hypothetical protein CCACVL1_12346 [Corchorus capsularis]|uniref:Uncharacterized protein n=1 Tax=Corchorus capsularis TaxID=210143 RepID=A0A1R3IG75_COCAP|nr:hypothetical protein CCACVL1_12346 [Corchorus capsularis]